jgi:hypothetical protein
VLLLCIYAPYRAEDRPVTGTSFTVGIRMIIYEELSSYHIEDTMCDCSFRHSLLKG